MSAKSKYSANMMALAWGTFKPVLEYRFHETRLWRFDVAWPDYRVAVEIDGGIWSRGRHTRGKGVLGDHEKYNHAASAGWLVFRCTPQNYLSQDLGALIREAIKLRATQI